MHDYTIVIEKAKRLAMDKISKRTGKARADKICSLSTKEIDAVLSLLTFNDRNHVNKKSPVEVEGNNDDDDVEKKMILITTTTKVC